MSTIASWQLTAPINSLLAHLNQMDQRARRAPEINKALSDLVKSIHRGIEDVEIAEHEWVVRNAQSDIAKSTARAEEILEKRREEDASQ